LSTQSGLQIDRLGGGFYPKYKVPLESKMPRTRGTVSISLSILLSIGLLAAPAWGNSPLGLGIVVYTERAHVGNAAASVGATVFAGDKLETEQVGSLQIRAGAARLVLKADRPARR